MKTRVTFTAQEYREIVRVLAGACVVNQEYINANRKEDSDHPIDRKNCPVAQKMIFNGLLWAPTELLSDIENEIGKMMGEFRAEVLDNSDDF
jgi:hypothetical protein